MIISVLGTWHCYLNTQTLSQGLIITGSKDPNLGSCEGWPIDVNLISKSSGKSLHPAMGVNIVDWDDVTDAHILSYFSVFYTDLFDEVFMFESLSLV